MIIANRVRIVAAALVGALALAAVAFAPGQHAQSLPRLDFNVAYAQKGAPVQIVSVTHSMEFLLDKASVKNLGDHTLRSVTFGVLLDNYILASKQEVPTNIQPGDTRELDVLTATLKEVRQASTALPNLPKNTVKVWFGITAVKFDDGSVWSVDPVTEGGFQSQVISQKRNAPDQVHCTPRQGGWRLWKETIHWFNLSLPKLVTRA